MTERTVLSQFRNQGMVEQQTWNGLMAQIHFQVSSGHDRGDRLLCRIEGGADSSVYMIPQSVEINKRVNTMITHGSTVPSITKGIIHIFRFTWNGMHTSYVSFQCTHLLNAWWHSGHAISWAGWESGISVGKVRSLIHKSGTLAQTSGEISVMASNRKRVARVRRVC